MIHPKDMKQVSVTGPKNRIDTVIAALYEQGVLHIDEYDGDHESLDIGSPLEHAETLSQQLVTLSGLQSKLPDVERSNGEQSAELDIDELNDEVNRLHGELHRVREEKDTVQHKLHLLDTLHDLGVRPDSLTDFGSLDVYVGTVNDFAFTDELTPGRYELHRDGNTIALFVDHTTDVEEALRQSGFDPLDVTPVLDESMEPGHLRKRVQDLRKQERNYEDELRELARTWKGRLDSVEAQLSRELEQAEAPLSFATTANTFTVEGWIPADNYTETINALEDATDDAVHVAAEDADPHEAPVAHDNPAGVRPLESFIKLYGTPSYHEVDPTFLLLTFPLLFGFMLGDVGYGLTTMAVFYLLYRKFPGAKGLWFSLMYASVATIVFGLIYGEMFGFIMFGHDSDLAVVTGLHVFESLPILFHRPHELGLVLQLSLLIGVVHVNLGYLIGAYNEYVSHGVQAALFNKLSWIVIEIGAVIAYLSSPLVGAGVLLAGVVMLFKGEGVEGVVEIPSLLSNILSYLRIFGVTIAVLSLAMVVNSIAQPLFQSGNPLMIGAGVFFLILGHTFNTFIKIMEAGLQGIRLHYVEFFTKFFEGGGTYYKPFGSKQYYSR